MKICPTCNEEFDNELDVCPNDDTALEAVADEEAEIEAEAAAETAPEEAEAAEEEAEAEDAEEAAEVVNAAAAAAKQTVSAQSEGMSTFGKATVIVIAVLAIGAGLVFWKSNVGGHGSVDFSRMTEQEMQLLVKDFNPMQLQALAQNPEQKKQLVENISQLLALASQAKKEGMADDPAIKAELENMRMTLLAMNYDRKINADKGPMPQFGFIGEDRVRDFYGEEASAAPQPQPEANSNTEVPPAPAPSPAQKKDDGFLASALDIVGLGWVVGNAEARRNNAEFQRFLDGKLALLRKRGQFKEDQEPSEEEIKQARDAFAKTRIYYDEARAKLDSLGSLPEAERKEWEEFEAQFELQTKLQQAQFLVQNYVQEKLAKKLQVTDEEIKKYIEEHPELTNDEEKKKKAQEVLDKVKGGADFAELAKEFSEDPGSKDNGGLYENISKGQFAPEFEAAVNELEPGEIAPNLVKTNFGYHIIKLEKRGSAKGADGADSPTFDARHILISTMMKDPENPMGRELPIDQFVRQKLEKEKQEKMLEEIKKNNPIQIPVDFEVPQPSQEDLDKIRQQQEEQLKQLLEQQGNQDEGEGAKPAEAEKPAEPAKEEE